MTLNRIDAELAQWHSRLSTVGANLLDLDELFTFKRLRGDIDLTPAALTGVTATKIPPCLEAVRALWEYLRLLRENLQSAQELRKTLTRYWMPESVIKQIAFHLIGFSIALPTIEKTISERDLLSEAQLQQWTTPELLLLKMSSMFELSKATILEVDSAWERLESDLLAMEGEVNALKEIAARIGETDFVEIDAVFQRVAYLHSRIESDPLGVMDEVQKLISPQIERASVSLKNRQLERDALQNEFKATREIFNELQTINLKAQTALEECKRSIADPKELLMPLSVGLLLDLEKWRCTLEGTLSAGNLRAARVGIARWNLTANSHLQNAKSAYEANQAPLELKAELKGRLGALRVKERFYRGKGAAANPELEKLATEADVLLRQTPTLLEDALKKVEEYEKRVGKLSRV